MRTYLYMIFVPGSNPNEDHRIVISRFGVYLEYKDRSIIHTNIHPERLFPGREKLTLAEQKFIVDNAVEGKRYDAKQIEQMYRHGSFGSE